MTEDNPHDEIFKQVESVKENAINQYMSIKYIRLVQIENSIKIMIFV